MLVKWKFILYFPDDNDETELISSEHNVEIDLYKESNIPKNEIETYQKILISHGYIVYEFNKKTVLAITSVTRFKQSYNNDMELSKNIDKYIQQHNRKHNLKDLLSDK